MIASQSQSQWVRIALKFNTTGHVIPVVCTSTLSFCPFVLLSKVQGGNDFHLGHLGPGCSLVVQRSEQYLHTAWLRVDTSPEKGSGGSDLAAVRCVALICVFLLSLSGALSFSHTKFYVSSFQFLCCFSVFFVLFSSRFSFVFLTPFESSETTLTINTHFVLSLFLSILGFCNESAISTLTLMLTEEKGERLIVREPAVCVLHTGLEFGAKYSL